MADNIFMYWFGFVPEWWFLAILVLNLILAFPAGFVIGDLADRYGKTPRWYVGIVIGGISLYTLATVGVLSLLRFLTGGG